MRLFLLSLVLIIFLIGNQPAESWKLNANFKVKCKVQKRLFWFLNLSNISISTHFTFKRLEYDIKLSGSYTTIDQVRSQVDCSIRCILSPPPPNTVSRNCEFFSWNGKQQKCRLFFKPVEKYDKLNTTSDWIYYYPTLKDSYDVDTMKFKGQNQFNSPDKASWSKAKTNYPLA